MDAAAAARMFNPEMNPNFRRRWQEPPEEPVTVVPTDRGPSALAQALLEAWLRKTKPDREG